MPVHEQQRARNNIPNNETERSASSDVGETERKPVWVKMTNERRKRVLEARAIIAREIMKNEGEENERLREFTESFSVPSQRTEAPRMTTNRRRMSNQSNESVMLTTSESSFVAEADVGAGISSGTEAFGGEDQSDSDESELGSFRLSEVEDIEDYYHLLDVHHHSDTQEIREAYRWLALRTHPDKCGNAPYGYNYTERAVKVFQRVGEAYRTLSNPLRRWIYDEYGDSGIVLVDEGDEKDVEELKRRYAEYMRENEPGKEDYGGRAKRSSERSRQKTRAQGGFKKLAADACFVATERVTRLAGAAADGATSGAAQGARIGAYLAPLTFGLSLPTLSAMGSVIGAARASIGELRKEQ